MNHFVVFLLDLPYRYMKKRNHCLENVFIAPAPALYCFIYLSAPCTYQTSEGHALE